MNKYLKYGLIFAGYVAITAAVIGFDRGNSGVEKKVGEQIDAKDIRNLPKEYVNWVIQGRQ